MLKKLELKIPPLVVTLIFGLIAWGISNWFSSASLSITLFKVASYVIFGLGVVIALVAVIKFKKEDTTVDPTSPSKSTSLVINGVYRYTRNPMYLSFFLWLLAYSLYLGNPINLLSLVFFIIYMNNFQIKAEERVLKETFGNEYEVYSSRVRRWI